MWCCRLRLLKEGSLKWVEVRGWNLGRRRQIWWNGLLILVGLWILWGPLLVYWRFLLLAIHSTLFHGLSAISGAVRLLWTELSWTILDNRSSTLRAELKNLSEVLLDIPLQSHFDFLVDKQIGYHVQILPWFDQRIKRLLLEDLAYQHASGHLYID